MNTLLVYLAVHIVCAIIVTGVLFASFQRGFQSIRKIQFFEDREFSVFMGLVFGPVGVVGLLLSLAANPTTYQGWLWPWSKKAVYEAFSTQE